MATRIYKYRVHVGVSLSVPGLVKVLMFGSQGAEGLFVWAEVTDGIPTSVVRMDAVLTGPVRTVVLDVLPTGAVVPHGAKHWASCQEGNGSFVWHLYERASS
jgi:hypothetical protein